MIDFFSRWCEAFPLRHQDAETTATVLVTEVFGRYGIPYIIHSDQGAQFESELMQAICEKFDIARTRTTAYHPQGNGMTERVNRTIIEMLATVSDHAASSWDQLIPLVLMAYRSSVNASTGYTPHYLLFGREMKIPLDFIIPTPDTICELDSASLAEKFHSNINIAFEIARENMRLAQRHQQAVYDRRTFGKRYAVGNQVWLNNAVKPKGISAKFFRPWSGPWIVTKIISDVDYKIQKLGSRIVKVVHFDRLRKCHKLPVKL